MRDRDTLRRREHATDVVYEILLPEPLVFGDLERLAEARGIDRDTAWSVVLAETAAGRMTLDGGNGAPAAVAIVRPAIFRRAAALSAEAGRLYRHVGQAACVALTPLEPGFGDRLVRIVRDVAGATTTKGGAS